MTLDEFSIAEVVRSLARIEKAIGEIREDLQADHDRLGRHATEIAVIQAAVTGWRQWTGAGIVAGLTGLVEWFFHRASS